MTEYNCNANSLSLQGRYRILPEFHTLEAEALGAVITPDDMYGYRISSPQYSRLSDLEFPGNASFDTPEIREAAGAASDLVKSGVPVIFELSGPLTILNALLDTKELLRSFRRNGTLLDETLDKLQSLILPYSLLLLSSGIRHLCLADPICSERMIGPELKRDYVIDHILPLLTEIKHSFDGPFLLHLCPKLFLSLQSYGLLNEVTIPLPEKSTFEDGYDAALGHADLVGTTCVKRSAGPVPGGNITGLCL